MDEQRGPTGAFLHELGPEIRRRRVELGLTMQRLADAATVSLRMLSSIELGTANPSLVTIGKIARALGVDFATLARGPRQNTLSINPPGTVPGLWSSAAGSRAQLAVASSLQPVAEVWDWSIVPGDHYDAEPDPPGSEELFVVISGTLTLVVDDVPTSLPAGSSARLATDRNYGYRNDGRRPVRFIRVAQVAT